MDKLDAESISIHELLTLIDPAETAVVHLVGAVEDDDKLAETSPHVLDRLRLSRPGWSGRGAPQGHPQRLSQRDVTPTHRKFKFIRGGRWLPRT